jgi:hypothetical protein
MPTPVRQGCGWRVLIMGVGLALTSGALAQADGGFGDPRATDLMPLEVHEQRFRITQGKAAGTETKLIMEPVQNAARGDWRLALEGFNEIYLQQTPDGGIAISQITIHTSNRRIVFGEPVPLLPARMNPGEAQHMQTMAYIYDAKTGEQTYSGPVEHQLIPRGRTRFALPIGEVSGFEVEMKQKVSLRLANVYLKLQAGFVPGEGMVRRRMELTVKKLGLFGSTNVTVSELAEPLQEQSASR